MKEGVDVAEKIGNLMISVGINELKDILKESYDYLENKYGGLFVRFQQKTETGWYKNEGILTVVLRKKGCNLWENWNNDQRVAIIGAGSYSRQLLHVATEKHKDTTYIYDYNEKNVGKEYWGTIIRGMNDIVDNSVDIVIVALKDINKISSSWLTRLGGRVIYIGKYLENEE